MKLILLILSSMLISSALAESKTLLGSIPFIKGGDFCTYKRVYKYSKREYVGRYTFLTQKLLEAGSYGQEASNILRDYQREYDRDLRKSTDNFGKSFERSIFSHLSSLFRQHRPQEKKLIVINTNVAIKLGNVDYSAYGLYDIHTNCRSMTLYFTLTDLKSGEETSFTATGSPSQVAARLAKQVFNHFYQTKLPSTVRFRGQELTLLDVVDQNSRRTDWQSAKWACLDMGGRLPKSEEIQYIKMLGAYGGGIKLHETSYYWVEREDYVFIPYFQSMQTRHLSEVNKKKNIFFCVSNSVSN